MSGAVKRETNEAAVAAAAKSATRDPSWPEWYSESADRERAYVRVSPEATIEIGVLSWPATLDGRAADSEEQSTDILLCDVVRQWPPEWGPIPSDLSEPSDRIAAYKAHLRARDLARIGIAAQILSKN